jgi:hypothetical protein
MEASGATDPDPVAGAERLAEARAAWEELNRPLDAARCELLRGRVLAKHDSEAAQEALDSAAERWQELGVDHLAEHARELVAS